MRKTNVLAGLFVLAAAASFSGIAQADDWCRSSRGTRDCHFASLQQCSLSANLFGGSCERARSAYRDTRSSFVERNSYEGRPYREREARHSAARASYAGYAGENLGHITYSGSRPACAN